MKMISQADVPPKSLRVGVGPFEDEQLFIDSGKESVELAERLVGLKPTHRVLDVGCGCGRIALAMRSFLSESGSYVGFDPNDDYINWCGANIAVQDDRFSFHHIDLLSQAYNPRGKESPEELDFPEIGKFDIAILSSVFTHMYPKEIENYVHNLTKVIQPGGGVLVSALLMNSASRMAI